MTIWLNIDEHAAKRHTTARAIYNERCRGQGPKAVRSGRILLWAEDEIDRYLAARAKSPAEPRQARRNRNTARAANTDVCRYGATR